MLSIIIPVLNEEQNIGLLLKHLDNAGSVSNILEIIVVDGGSTDGTAEIVNEFSNDVIGPEVIYLTSERGRAKQMNVGAAKARGNVLYFLHADSLPPENFDEHVLEAVRNGKLSGCFRMKFDNSHPILKFSQYFTRFNHRACRGGDQSLFVQNELFESLGGYNEDFTVYEDCELINRLYDGHTFTILKDYVITSARRYKKNGTFKLQYHFTIIHLKKWLGASPDELSRYYHKHIVS